MKSRRILIRSLIVINLLMAIGCIFMVTHLPPAFAQSGGNAKYLAVTAEYAGGTDALYILHTGKGVMSVLVPEQGVSGTMRAVGLRDISTDLGAKSSR
ncbi:MAG: hypothetical protein HJJLKODD_02659 [Phycisphaerae bacterium]|nr:hypothetical protein [Phycisphaerae bacterium]